MPIWLCRLKQLLRQVVEIFGNRSRKEKRLFWRFI